MQAGIENFKWRFPVLSEELRHRKHIERKLAAMTTEELHESVNTVRNKPRVGSTRSVPVSAVRVVEMHAVNGQGSFSGKTTTAADDTLLNPVSASVDVRGIGALTVERNNRTSGGERSLEMETSSATTDDATVTVHGERGLAVDAVVLEIASPRTKPKKYAVPPRADLRAPGSVPTAVSLSVGQYRRSRGVVVNCISYARGSPLSILSLATAIGFMAFAILYVVLFGLVRPGNEVCGKVCSDAIRL